MQLPKHYFDIVQIKNKRMIEFKKIITDFEGTVFLNCIIISLLTFVKRIAIHKLKVEKRTIQIY